MRRAECVTFVTEQISKLFEADVAKALVSDEDVIENVARLLNENHGTAEDITAALSRVAQDLNDNTAGWNTADWLVDNADAAGKWLYCRVREL